MRMSLEELLNKPGDINWKKTNNTQALITSDTGEKLIVTHIHGDNHDGFAFHPVMIITDKVVHIESMDDMKRAWDIVMRWSRESILEEA